MPSAAQGWRNKKGIWGRGNFLQIWYNGKDLKVIHHDGDIHHTQQQPKATRCHVPPAACQAFWHQHFCASCHLPFLAALHGEAWECLCPPLPQRLLMQALLSRTPARHSDTFIRRQAVTIRAEQGCQCRQMLLDFINWVSPATWFQEGQNNVGLVGTHGRSEAHADSCSGTQKWGWGLHPLLSVFLTVFMLNHYLKI